MRVTGDAPSQAPTTTHAAGGAVEVDVARAAGEIFGIAPGGACPPATDAPPHWAGFPTFPTLIQPWSPSVLDTLDTLMSHSPLHKRFPDDENHASKRARVDASGDFGSWLAGSYGKGRGGGDGFQTDTLPLQYPLASDDASSLAFFPLEEDPHAGMLSVLLELPLCDDADAADRQLAELTSELNGALEDDLLHLVVASSDLPFGAEVTTPDMEEEAYAPAVTGFGGNFLDLDIDNEDFMLSDVLPELDGEMELCQLVNACLEEAPVSSSFADDADLQLSLDVAELRLRAAQQSLLDISRAVLVDAAILSPERETAYIGRVTACAMDTYRTSSSFRAAVDATVVKHALTPPKDMEAAMAQVVACMQRTQHLSALKAGFGG
jgi:hypothetical protein